MRDLKAKPIVERADELLKANGLPTYLEMLTAIHTARGALHDLTGKGDRYAKRNHERAMKAIDAVIDDAYIDIDVSESRT